MPYLRDPETLARPWAVPGTPGPRAPDRRPGEGGRDRQRLVRPRQPRLHGPRPRAEGRRDRGIPTSRSTTTRARSCSCSAGAARTGRSRPRCGSVRDGGGKVAQAHLRHLNPFPRNLGDVLRAYDRVLVPEMNLGQLLKLVRAEFLVDAAGYNQSARAAVHLDRAGGGDGGDVVSENGNGNGLVQLTAKDFKTDQEVRWCPGCGDYAILAAMQSFMPELGHRARAARLRLRDRLRGTVPVLHADLRDALDPRARAGDRDRARVVAARPVRLGRDRRRRRALDRRQPPDPRAAPQRQREDPALQQPDLRADQGAVLADVASSAR